MLNSHCIILRPVALHNHNIVAEDTSQTHTGPLIVSSVSVSPWDPCLVDSVDCVILVPFSDSYNPSSPSSARLPKFRGYGSLHLLLSVVR